MKNEIVVFKNNKKVGAQPDYRATIRIGGTEYEAGLWKKDTKVGPVISGPIKLRDARFKKADPNDAIGF
jgi:hypothetical protein